MRSTTRNRLLVTGGIATAAGLYVTIATMDGANWRPFTEDIEQTATSAKDGFTDWADGALRWMLETEINPATILIGFIAWLGLAAIVRRANRAWDLTGHTAKALKSDGSKATGRWTGITIGALLLLGALGLGGTYGGIALGENFKPEVVAAYQSTEKTVNGWFEEKEEPKAAPATSTTPAGNADDEPVEPAAPVPTQSERTEEPKDRTDATTGDNRTETPADSNRTEVKDDKPVTDAFKSIANHGDQIFTDPVKWMGDNPWKALGLALFLLVWLFWTLLKWRQDARIARELVFLRKRVRTQDGQIASLTSRIGTADEDGTVMHSLAMLDRYVRDDDRRLTALETQPPRGNGGDKRVAGGPTTD